MSQNAPMKGDVYRHYKGNEYIIVCVAKDTEDGSLRVIYQSTDPEKPQIWDRSLRIFNSRVSVKSSHGIRELIPRFSKV